MPTNSKTLPGMSVQRLSDANGHDYIRLTFPRTGNRTAGEIVDSLSILGQPQNVKNQLLQRGYKLDPGLPSGTLVAELQKLLPDEAKPLFTETGWIEHGSISAFAFPDAVIGEAKAELLVTPNVQANSIAKGGTLGKLRAWRELVAQPALKSQAASLAIMAAFASPLLRYSDLSESFTLNIAGQSSSGKSTAVAAAISVWGNPQNCLSWDATDGAIADLAVANNGFGLFLDDVEKQAGDLDVKVKRVRDLIHKIVSGATRHRSAFAARDSSLQSKRYECIAFCSSPETIERFCRDARKPLLASESVRFLEIKVPAGDEGGIFATSGEGAVTMDSLNAVKALKANAESNYGKAGRKWVHYLVEHEGTLRKKVATLSAEFHRRLGNNIGAIERRVADKFALIYAAGSLAARVGILPFSAKTVGAIAVRGYHDAIAAGFPDRFSPDAAILRIEAFLTTKDVRRTKKKLNQLHKGARKGYIADTRLVLLLHAFKQVLTDPDTGSAPSPADFDRLCRRLENSGALLPGHGGRTQDVHIARSKQKRLVFNMQALRAEFELSRKANNTPHVAR